MTQNKTDIDTVLRGVLTDEQYQYYKTTMSNPHSVRAEIGDNMVKELARKVWVAVEGLEDVIKYAATGHPVNLAIAKKAGETLKQIWGEANQPKRQPKSI